MTRNSTNTATAQTRRPRRTEEGEKAKVLAAKRWQAFTEATEPRADWEDRFDDLLNDDPAVAKLWDDGEIAGKPDATPLDRDIALGIAMCDAGFTMVETVKVLGDVENPFQHGTFVTAVQIEDWEQAADIYNQIADVLSKHVTGRTKAEYEQWKLRETGRMLAQAMPEAATEARERPVLPSPDMARTRAMYEHAAVMLDVEVAALHRNPALGPPNDCPDPGEWMMVTICMDMALNEHKHQATMMRKALKARLSKEHGHEVNLKDIEELVAEFRTIADRVEQAVYDARPFTVADARKVVRRLQSILFKASEEVEVEVEEDPDEPQWRPPAIDPLVCLTDDETLEAWADKASKMRSKHRVPWVAQQWMRQTLVSDNSNVGRSYYLQNPDNIRFPFHDKTLVSRFADYGPAFLKWGSGGDTPTCWGVRFNPHSLSKKYVSDGAAYLNIYRGVMDGTLPGGSNDQAADAVMDAFFEHLIPDDEEREWYLDWLCRKWHEPWERMCMILMVADGQTGTGRGTLRQILQRVFMGQTQKVSFRLLTDSAFNGFLEDNLILFCDEVGGNNYAAKVAASELLKDRFDPDHREETINRKHIAEYSAMIYASGMFSTNNGDAFHLDPEDRRVAVITNTVIKLSDAAPVAGVKGETLGEQVYETVGFDRIAMALSRKLAARTWTRNPNSAPHFAGRERMIAKSENDVTEAMRAVIEKADGPMIWPRKTFEQLVKGEWKAMTGKTGGVRSAVGELTGAAMSTRLGAALSDGEVMIAGKRHRQVVMTSDVVRTFARLTPDEKAAMVYGGPTTDAGMAAKGVEEALKRVERR